MMNLICNKCGRIFQAITLPAPRYCEPHRLDSSMTWRGEVAENRPYTMEGSVDNA